MLFLRMDSQLKCSVLQLDSVLKFVQLLDKDSLYIIFENFPFLTDSSQVPNHIRMIGSWARRILFIAVLTQYLS